MPFGNRRAQWDARLAAKQLKVDFWDHHPGRENGSVLSWDLLNDTDIFVDYGRIIRHDEKPHSPAARLGWVRYDAHQTGYQRELESKAVYTIDDAEIGQGIVGFESVLRRIETLPEGSVVRLSVCLKTKGPFHCPLIYEGVRHFERTGCEPYHCFLPLFLNVAERRNFTIEWLPDEGESCGDCE